MHFCINLLTYGFYVLYRLKVALEVLMMWQAQLCKSFGTPLLLLSLLKIMTQIGTLATSMLLQYMFCFLLFCKIVIYFFIAVKYLDYWLWMGQTPQSLHINLQVLQIHLLLNLRISMVKFIDSLVVSDILGKPFLLATHCNIVYKTT